MTPHFSLVHCRELPFSKECNGLDSAAYWQECGDVQPFAADCNFAVFVSKMGSLPCTKMQQPKEDCHQMRGNKLQMLQRR